MPRALLLHNTYIHKPEAFWSVDLDIYIFTISMSHDLRVSSLAATRAMFNIQLTRASKLAFSFAVEYLYQCAAFDSEQVSN